VSSERCCALHGTAHLGVGVKNSGVDQLGLEAKVPVEVTLHSGLLHLAGAPHILRSVDSKLDANALRTTPCVEVREEGVRQGARAVDRARLGLVEVHAALAVLPLLVRDVPRPEHRPDLVRDRRVALGLVVVGREESPLRNPDALQVREELQMVVAIVRGRAVQQRLPHFPDRRVRELASLHGCLRALPRRRAPRNSIADIVARGDEI
jgi:hypothetical protein